MKKFLYQLLSEDGTISEARLASLLCIVVAAAIAFMGVAKPNVDYSGLAMLCGTFIGVGVGGKTVQKWAEVQDHKTGNVTKTHEVSVAGKTNENS